MESSNCPQQEKGQEQGAFHFHSGFGQGHSSPSLLVGVLCVCTAPGRQGTKSFFNQLIKGQRLVRALFPPQRTGTELEN